MIHAEILLDYLDELISKDGVLKVYYDNAIRLFYRDSIKYIKNNQNPDILNLNINFLLHEFLSHIFCAQTFNVLGDVGYVEAMNLFFDIPEKENDTFSIRKLIKRYSVNKKQTVYFLGGFLSEYELKKIIKSINLLSSIYFDIEEKYLNEYSEIIKNHNLLNEFYLSIYKNFVSKSDKLIYDKIIYKCRIELNFRSLISYCYIDYVDSFFEDIINGIDPKISVFDNIFKQNNNFKELNKAYSENEELFFSSETYLLAKNPIVGSKIDYQIARNNLYRKLLKILLSNQFLTLVVKKYNMHGIKVDF